MRKKIKGRRGRRRMRLWTEEKGRSRTSGGKERVRGLKERVHIQYDDGMMVRRDVEE